MARHSFNHSAASFSYEHEKGTALFYEPGLIKEDREISKKAWGLIPEPIKNGLIDNGVNIYISHSWHEKETAGYTSRVITGYRNGRGGKFLSEATILYAEPTRMTFWDVFCMKSGISLT